MRPLRSLIYLLLLVNIASYYWYSQYADEIPAAATVETPLPKGVQTLNLLNEDKQQPAPASRQKRLPPPTKRPTSRTTNSKVATTTVPPAAASKHQQVCLRGGPFKTLKERITVKHHLSSLPQTTVSESNEKAASSTTYWVGLGRTEHLTDANKVMAELLQAGITDTAVIPLKAGGYLVSLGLYRSEEIARKRRKKIRQLGFDARIHPRTRQKTRYWLEIRTRQEGLLMSKLADKNFSLPTTARFKHTPCSK